MNGGSTYAVEDYVWLDGAPVAIIRGALTLSGGAWVRGTETATTSCPKLSDGGFCGKYFLVTDAQARPVLMVRQSTGEVTQAATYTEVVQIPGPSVNVDRISVGDLPGYFGPPSGGFIWW